MRPILALFIAVCVLAGLGIYLQVIQSQPLPIEFDQEEDPASGVFSLELTLSFDAGPDPFAFEAGTAPSVLIQFKGEDVYRKSEPVAGEHPIIIRPIDGVVPGANEFFLQVSAEDQSSSASRAARLRILRDDTVVADHTVWSEPGLPVEGSVTLIVDEPVGHDPHDH